MRDAIELTGEHDRARQIVAADVQRLIERSRGQPTDGFRPISIQINVGNDRGSRWVGDGQYGFRFHRSKFFWVVVMLSLSIGVTYARTRVMCQSFRDQGRFYYGMDVMRCVDVLIQEPLASVERHLSKLDQSY